MKNYYNFNSSSTSGKAAPRLAFPMLKPFKSVRFKIISLSLLVLFNLVSIAINITQTKVQNIFQTQILTNLEAVSKSKAGQVSMLIEQDFERAALIASRTRLRFCLLDFITGSMNPEQNQKDMIQIIEDARNSVSALRDIDILASDGIVVASTNPYYLGRDDSKQLWFLQSLHGYYQSSFWREDENFYSTLALPLFHPEAGKENIIGVVKIDMSLERLVAVLTDYTGLGETGEFILVSQQDDQIIVMNPLRHDPDAALKPLGNKNDSGQQAIRLVTDGMFVTSFLPVKYLNLSEKSIILTPGTAVFCNTDGLTEQFTDGYYSERLSEVFYSNAHLSSQEVAFAVIEDFRALNKGSLQGKDDITFLVLKVEMTEV